MPGAVHSHTSSPAILQEGPMLVVIVLLAWIIGMVLVTAFLAGGNRRDYKR